MIKLTNRLNALQAGAGPISWADLIYLSGKVSVQAKWRASKVSP